MPSLNASKIVPPNQHNIRCDSSRSGTMALSARAVNLFGSACGIGMDSNGVLEVAGVAASVGYENGDTVLLADAEHQLIVLLQTIDAQPQPAKLIIFVRI